MSVDENEGRLITIRKLVALDISLHGPRFILLEFCIGTPVIILAGLWIMLTGIAFALGLYLLLTGANYVPLVPYAFIITRKCSAQSEVEYGLANNKHYVRKYSVQQLIIFVPFAVLLIAVAQEIAVKRKGIKS